MYHFNEVYIPAEQKAQESSSLLAGEKKKKKGKSNLTEIPNLRATSKISKYRPWRGKEMTTLILKSIDEIATEKKKKILNL